jgi:hypothetical protein
MVLYTVHQHRPAFVTGLEDQVVIGVAERDLMNPDVLPWLKSFQGEGFVDFIVEPYYGDDRLVSARYSDGKSWVAAIARPLRP